MNKDIKIITLIIAFLFLMIGILVTYNYFITVKMFTEVKTQILGISSQLNNLDLIE